MEKQRHDMHQRDDSSILFQPVHVGPLQLTNRIVMAPMTRCGSPGGIPGEDVAAYYRRRAEGGVGLIITEGTYISEDTAQYDPMIPNLYEPDALAGWSKVVAGVHAAGGRIIPQLWHIGLAPKSDLEEVYGGRPDEQVSPIGPSGLMQPGTPYGRAMSQADIDRISEAYVQASVTAHKLGFDGVELHAAHGYLIDEFFWEGTNQRTDQYGGTIADRSRFAADIVRQIRARTAPDFAMVLRFSQWKLQDLHARPWPTPDALAQFLSPLADAGVDVFHCSQRRFWLPEYEGSDLNLAGWTKKLSGKPTISVGSVTLGEEFIDALLVEGVTGTLSGIEKLIERVERTEFDLIAIGRALIANADWVEQVRRGTLADLRPFTRAMLASME